jgi:flavodoxin
MHYEWSFLSASPESKEKRMQRTLVVYFSRSGFTKGIAEEIAKRHGADLEDIKDTRPRSGLWGYLRSAREAFRKTLIPIQPAAKDPAGYELVVLGTPVWAGNVSSPMRAYLAAQRGRFKQVAFFCTQGGSGAEKVFVDMSELCARRPIASLALNDRDIKQGRYSAELDRFLGVLALPKAA